MLIVAAASYLIVSPALSKEISLGNTQAPVTLIEYGSMTCDGCIRFHKHVLPRIKEDYIDAGKVHFIYRHFPTSEVASQGAIAAQCSGDKYYEMLDELYFSLGSWYKVEDKKSLFTQYAASLGLDSKQFQSCLSSENQLQYISTKKQAAKIDYGVVGTPTFIINGKIVRGIRSYVEMKTLIIEALGDGNNDRSLEHISN